jgi:Uma2 family endonuclease
LIDGTLVEKPVGWVEGQIVINIAVALHRFVTPRHLGLITGADGTLRMATGQIRLPDVTFVSATDLPEGKCPDEPVPMMPPTLAVEVLSPGNTAGEMRQKIKEYIQSGSRLVWLVDPPTKTIAIYVEPSEKPAKIVQGNEVLDGGNVLPGFSMMLAEVFKTGL